MCAGAGGRDRIVNGVVVDEFVVVEVFARNLCFFRRNVSLSFHVVIHFDVVIGCKTANTCRASKLSSV